MSEHYPESQREPLISIIIPFFNTEEFLSQAIESVLTQTVKKWNLILVDDGSTDKGSEIAQSYVEKFPDKIRLLGHENNENKGAMASRNLGIAKVKSKYVTFLDSDDVFFPDTIERELKAFEENPEADAVCGTAECWFSWSDKREGWEKDFTIDLVLKTEKLYQPPELLVHNLVCGGRKPQPNCVAMKKEFALKIGMFEETCTSAWEDQVSWAKLTLNGKIYVMDAVLAKYRLHSASSSAIEMQNEQDTLSKTSFLDWLETYLREQNIKDREIWKSLESFRRKIYQETKFKKIKQAYRRFFPLHLRYKIRDKLTWLKQILSRSAHRHK